MKRVILLLFLLTTQHSAAQISNVRQTEDNGRIIITYDLGGDAGARCNISVTAVNDDEVKVKPTAIVGDLAQVAPGKGRTVWWEPRLEGLAANGWRIALNAVISRGAIGIKWILVEGGPGGAFYISATEITFDQYELFCKATGYEEPDSNFGRGKQPVINVDVADAMAFCKWLSSETGTIVRLPEEDEWEYAARGGKEGKGYQYSGSDVIQEIAWYNGNSGEMSHEVGTKHPNELGLFDMSGYVWEW